MIVPPPGISQIVEQLYEGHLGVSCMKNLARSLSFVQWPNIDSDLTLEMAAETLGYLGFMLTTLVL